MTLPGDESWIAELRGQRIIFGVGEVDHLGTLARTFGGSRALVVSDQGVRAAGHVAPALASLQAASVAAVIYDGVEENPTTRHVGEGLEVARGHGVDCIVGLGGGSAMDCAKAVNFLLTNGGKMEDYWGSGKASRPMLPSIGIPTTAGTGSEAQSYALICQEGSGVKMACGDSKALFRGVILDPRLVSSVPREIAGIAGIDAISHAVESYVTTRRTPISQQLAREAWCLLERHLPTVLTHGNDLAAWGSTLLGANLAGAAIEQSMLGAAHACANPLTARFAMAHGVAVGIMLPHVIRFNASEVGELYDELRRAADADAASPLDERILELRRLAGLPESLRDYSIPRDCLPELAMEAETQWTAGFNPRPVKRKELLELYEAAYA